LCQGAKTAWQALGHVDYGRKSSEQGNAQFRRSLYFVKDLKAGDVIDESSIRSVRPGYGLPPKFYDELLGKKVTQDVSVNTPVKLEIIS
ncbi:TPA: pseudaminic acid synthase, partial [Klebsiella pneumoniae]|nr:pseudaminic acid synthase [Klebsiella pneumoniae]